MNCERIDSNRLNDRSTRTGDVAVVVSKQNKINGTISNVPKIHHTTGTGTGTGNGSWVTARRMAGAERKLEAGQTTQEDHHDEVTNPQCDIYLTYPSITSPSAFWYRTVAGTSFFGTGQSHTLPVRESCRDVVNNLSHRSSFVKVNPRLFWLLHGTFTILHTTGERTWRQY